MPLVSESVPAATSPAATPPETVRLRVVIRGAVQGVGFRPYIYRLATEMGLAGWVNNSSSGVFIEVEGSQPKLAEFLCRVEREKPAISFIQSLESAYLDPVGFTGFEIRPSVGGEKTALVMPDVATCPECRAEIFDPSNRRYRYPFTNCTNCGPRFTIIESLPYDRPATTMKGFNMCQACREEYENPADRRFHAQPNACPECGPQLAFWTREGDVVATLHEPLKQAADAIRAGRVVAVKGLGGFHLMVDARNEAAIRTLRQRKHREAKPLALMVPSLAMIERDCEVSAAESRMLTAPESPIVLLRKKPCADANLAPIVAPANPYLGVMLPYTPLHHLLMAELGFPVVATSGNLSDEPICTDEREAIDRLHGIADDFLVHDRPILCHVDDSIVRIVMGRELVLRRARGFAPLPVMLDSDLPAALGVGAHQKNTIATSVGRQVFVSQHIGDLETTQAFGAFERVIESFATLYEQRPNVVACDLHPNYMSTEYALRTGTELVRVQHHYAHALSCMAENGIEAPTLGIVWDGSGYGTDGTIWGGEFLAVDDIGFRRVAHLRSFRLPGSETAVKEPRRSAAGLLFEMFGDEAFERNYLAPMEAFTREERSVLRAMLAKGLNSPVTSSAGRLFDAVSSLIGLRHVVGYEGQAAMELEFLATGSDETKTYTINIEPAHADIFTQQGQPLIVDWARMVVEILLDAGHGVSKATIARKFHNTLAEAMVEVAKAVSADPALQPTGGAHGWNNRTVALSGGCFQNKLLTELAVARLRAEGFKVYWHQRIPPNDGGISLGQIVAASRSRKVEG
jgi:hydrogenase maturation protein HypF